MNLWELPPETSADFPQVTRMVVETPCDSSSQYEYNPQLGLFQLRRALHSPMHYPGDYGFIPGTIAQDGEPLDVLLLSQTRSFSGCLCEVRPLAVLELVDQTVIDHKILAASARDPRFTTMLGLDDVFLHTQREVEHFFAIYKELEAPRLKVSGWRDYHAAATIVRESRARFLDAQTAAAVVV